MLVYGAESFDRLFRRCVDCGDETPSCPTCDEGYVCSVTALSCNSCPSTYCVVDSSATTPTPKKSHSSPNVGAIAGGVIGGVAVIAIATYLVWRFCIKTRRQQYEQENWIEELEDEAAPANGDEKSTFAAQRDARASTYTVGSIASTVLTRASNIIQIAYIPGVTNRSAPSTPGLLVPPVPPIPIALSSAASSPAYNDQHFFMPGDLRDSTYSGISDRTSYARTSVASTIYGKNAIVSPLPAQTVIRGKAAVVSVGSKTTNNSSTNIEVTPPVPALDYEKYKAAGPPSPAFSVGSTFLSNASAATAMKPTMVSVSSASKSSGLNKVTNSSDDEESPSNRNTSESMTTFIDDSSNPNSPYQPHSPFSDPAEKERDMADSKSLSRVIEEATRRASSGPGRGLASSGRTPFGDEHSIDD